MNLFGNNHFYMFYNISISRSIFTSQHLRNLKQYHLAILLHNTNIIALLVISFCPLKQSFFVFCLNIFQPCQIFLVRDISLLAPGFSSQLQNKTSCFSLQKDHVISVNLVISIIIQKSSVIE